MLPLPSAEHFKIQDVANQIFYVYSKCSKTVWTQMRTERKCSFTVFSNVGYQVS